MTQITINTGIVITQILGLPQVLATVPYWRIILAIGGFIAVAQLILLPMCVESPQWLASHNRLSEAKHALMKIRGHRNVDDEIDVLRRGSLAPGALDDNETGVHEGLLSPGEETQREKVSLAQFLTSPEHRQPLIAIVGIMLAQQFLGINAIIMYGVSVLGELIPKQSAFVNVIISIVNFFATITAARFIDKLGRKPLLLASIIGMGIFAGLMGVGIIWHIQILSALSTILFVASFACGLGPVPFMIASEMVEHDAVGAAQSIGLTVNWLATFAVAYGFPLLRIWLGSGVVFFVFSIMSVVFGFFVMRFVPETKGRTVNEVWGRPRRLD